MCKKTLNISARVSSFERCYDHRLERNWILLAAMPYFNFSVCFLGNSTITDQACERINVVLSYWPVRHRLHGKQI